MASIWGKATSIFAGNLNSGRSYLIRAVRTTDIVVNLEVWYDVTGGTDIGTGILLELRF